MINVKNLVKSYEKGETAVKGVSFSIGEGEIVGLLGPNGAGKSTIMKILTCYMHQTSGEIFVNEKSTLDDPLYIRGLIGYLPEHTPQYDDMTVYEYLNFTANIRCIEKGKIKDSVEKMIELTSLTNVVSKKVGQLSKGYKKRVGLASVLIHDPKILILDEPTSGLDPSQIIAFRKILRRFSEKKTIILSTHILSEIEAICERVIIINNGVIVADDTIQNLVEQHSNEKYGEFIIEGDNLLKVESAISDIKGVNDIEFEKKVARNLFKFRALLTKNEAFESDLKDIVEKNGWKLVSFEKKSPDLEEIFLNLVGGSSEN
jgi:ABC-2 type transport system ATP-binding protein